MENTSGQGSTIVAPDEVKGWNWGAFLLTFIWGAGNRVWSTALVGVPFIGFFIPFIVGAKGSEWAWQNKEWESIEHFKEVQRKWAYWGFGVTVACFVVFFSLGMYGFFDEEEAELSYEAEPPSQMEPVAMNERAMPIAPPPSPAEPVAIAIAAPAPAPAPAITPAPAPTPAVPAVIDTPAEVPPAVPAPSASPVAQAPVAATQVPVRRKTYTSIDLRECLDRETIEAIAQCAERF